MLCDVKQGMLIGSKLVSIYEVCMLIDVFVGTNILSAWVSVYLAILILASSAFNPWVYGYRNTELRAAARRVIDDLLTTFGFTYRSHQVSDPIALSAAATAGDQASFIHHAQRDCLEWKPQGDFLLVPIARPESSGVVSENDLPNILRENAKLGLTSETPRLLKGSRSMVDSFAITRGSDVLIIKGRGMLHGASII
ncbi:hypothetical protein WA026_011304 [Henosepilachna vigintioctopunctata]|uniref:Uncharacterized protein n=1 Tax=Henosepilachna vigintioctopunctata TaxID=420089 RepID=A0AAW1U6G1_9CUCU